MTKKVQLTLFLIVFLLMIGSLAVCRLNPNLSSLTPLSQVLHAQWVQGFSPWMYSALGAETGSSQCTTLEATAWSSCVDRGTAYTHTSLNIFNRALCVIDQGMSVQVEAILCHLEKSLGFSPNLASLPVVQSQSLGSSSVTISVTTPTEPFASSLGYTAKASVSVSGTLASVLYWSGSGTSSKGFMINGSTPIDGGALKRLSYVQWDRTSSSSQFVNVLAANYTTSYLSEFKKMLSSTPEGGDQALYGQVTYNPTTKAVTLESVAIAAQNVLVTTAGCYKVAASGTKGGSMIVGKTAAALTATGHATTDTVVDGSDMDASLVADLTTTAEGTGFFSTPSSAGLTVSLGKTCEQLRGASASGQLFADGNVTFTATPTDVF